MRICYYAWEDRLLTDSGDATAKLSLELVLILSLSLFLASSPSHSLAGLAWLSKIRNDPPT